MRELSNALQVLMSDNDGTFSTLRGAWKHIMEGYMMSVLTMGGKLEDDAMVAAMREAVRTLIHETDGINTIEQTALFCELVQEWRTRTGADIPVLSDEVHKARYVRLMQADVLPKYEGLCLGTLKPQDVTVAGAIEFFSRFQHDGGTACIFSGTDDALLKADIHLIACAADQHGEHLFHAINGALLDRKLSSKDSRMDEFLRTSGIPAHEIGVVGDGPVELIVGRRYGCYTVAVAENQERRDFLTRKVREGLGLGQDENPIDLFIPDFREAEALVDYFRAA